MLSGLFEKFFPMYERDLSRSVNRKILGKGERKIKIRRVVNAQVKYNMDTREVENLRGEIKIFKHKPDNNSIPTCVIPKGDIWFVVQAYFYWKVDSTAIQRNCQPRYYAGDEMSMIIGTPQMDQGKTISLTADQEGFTSQGSLSHGALWDNDNGSISRTSAYSALPRHMRGGDHIDGYFTNIQTGDRGMLIVFYEKVGSE